MDKKLFAQEMARLGTVFNRALDRPGISAYFEATKHLTDDELRWAVKEAVESERFFPPPAVLLELARSLPKPALMAARRSEEEKALSREEAKKGVEMIRAYCKERGVEL